MSDLYKEALADAKKLREIAEEDARKAIMEKVSPYIKKMIAKETANATNFFFEEEETPAVGEDPATETLPTSAATDATPEAQGVISEPGSSSVEAPMADASTMSPPISAVGSEVANIPLPDADGKITIDFEQLFTTPGVGDTVEPVDPSVVTPGEELSAAPPPGAAPIETDVPSTGDDMSSSSAEAETPVAPAAGDLVGAETTSSDEVPEEPEASLPQQPVAESLMVFKGQLAEAAFGIERAYFAKRVSNIAHERLKNNLLGLLESLDNMLEKGVITESQARLNEKRLEFLFLKLKEAALANSYKAEKDEKEDPMGKTLKEYAAKLFESDEQENLEMDSVNSGDTGVPVRKDATAHAKEQSGVSPEVDDLFKEETEVSSSKTMGKAAKAGTVDASALPNTGKAHKKPWQEAEPSTVSEEVEAEGHAGFGDSAEKPVATPDMFFEIDEKELMEAVAAIRKESSEAAKKATKGGWEKGEPKGKPMSPKDAMKDKAATVKENVMDGMEEDLVLSVELPDDVEAELDAEDLDVNLMLSGEDEDLEGSEDMMDSDEEASDETMDMVVSDDEEGEEDMESASSEEDMLLTDEEDELAEVQDSPMTGAASGRGAGGAPMRESRVAKALRLREMKARKLLEANRAETKQMKKEMAETNLFLSKLLYLNKFLQREGLSRKVKQQIVEHLDRATTLAEAKDIYLRIKKKLDESVTGSSSAVLAGSASKPTAQGSARLNESARVTSSEGDEGNTIIGTFERWQKLARIGKSED